MVKIRLRKIGRRKLPIYQIVATDSKMPRDGKFLEVLGRYEPSKKPHQILLNKERVSYWLRVGAQPTDTARNLIKSTGLLFETYMRRKGKSEEVIATEMEKWQKQLEERTQRRLVRKTVRRKRKKAAEAKAAEGQA
ncbi:MAG: 30S ribosomal protein S16 [Chlorobiales bacterium]|nr:30S ribosomal protein S16 [Chlorobiales bacterium]